jgi:hypothetical protein
MTTIIIPEVVFGTRSPANLLHGQSALALKLALIDRPGTVVTSVPFLPEPPPEARAAAALTTARDIQSPAGDA